MSEETSKEKLNVYCRVPGHKCLTDCTPHLDCWKQIYDLKSQ